MDFTGFLGNDAVKARLSGAFASGRVAHSYLICGPVGSGKHTLTRILCAAMQCEGRGEKIPCGVCSGCRKALEGVHPDIITVDDPEHKSMTVEPIRAARSDMFIRPNEGKRKIYIIPRGQDMNESAQNALLKTIEEPPAYAVVMLLADNPDALLPTISSRCVQLNLKPVGDQLVKDYLMNEMHVPDYQAEVDASLAQGNIGKAERIARSPEYEETLENALRMAKYADSMPLYEIVETIKKLTAEKDNIDDYFDIFSLWFRDVLLFKATKEVDSLVFKQELNGIRERANKSSYEGLEKIIEAIQKARARLNANVNFDLTMELMFLTMKEN